jgi:hypothetical protein
MRYAAVMRKRSFGILFVVSSLLFLVSSAVGPTEAQGGSQCNFDSDCKGYGKCKGGSCGNCGFDSDCNIGKCASSHCGACNFDSDCKGGKCASNRCSNAP